MSNFGEIRKEALEHWLNETGRVSDDDVMVFGTFESRWAGEYTSDDMHNSLFCSMGDWNSHITDILKDNSLDDIEFDDELKTEVLFRYYTRFLLIVSEVLSDFSKVIELIEGGKQDKIRKTLSSPNLEFDMKNLIGYINNICKHKIEKSSEKALHNRNHHCNKVFADMPNYERSEDTVHVGDYIKEGFVKVQIESPRLKDVIDQILYCYSVIDLKLVGLNEKDRELLLSKFKVFEMHVDEVC
jgi:hypothetical protein